MNIGMINLGLMKETAFCVMILTSIGCFPFSAFSFDQIDEKGVEASSNSRQSYGATSKVKFSRSYLEIDQGKKSRVSWLTPEEFMEQLVDLDADFRLGPVYMKSLWEYYRDHLNDFNFLDLTDALAFLSILGMYRQDRVDLNPDQWVLAALIALEIHIEKEERENPSRNLYRDFPEGLWKLNKNPFDFEKIIILREWFESVTKQISFKSQSQDFNVVHGKAPKLHPRTLYGFSEDWCEATVAAMPVPEEALNLGSNLRDIVDHWPSPKAYLYRR